MSDPLRDALIERRARERGVRFTPGPHRVAMAYPSPYRAAMSSLGYQWVLQQLGDAGLAAERVMLPDDPEAWRRRRASPLSLETLSPLGSFPLIAVSLAYELELAGLITLLELAGIPPRREDRGPGHPVILLGGPLTFSNPLPAAPFVDAMLLGEAEVTAPAAAVAFFERSSREAWLDEVAKLPGAYVPERGGERPARGGEGRRRAASGAQPHPHAGRRAVRHVPDRGRTGLPPVVQLLRDAPVHQRRDAAGHARAHPLVRA